MAPGPVEAQGRSPVVDDEHDVLAQIEGLEQAVEILPMMDEAVGAGADFVELVGVALADQIRGDAAAPTGQVGDDVAPQVGRGRVAVEEHDRSSPRPRSW